VFDRFETLIELKIVQQTGHVTRVGAMRSAHKILVGRPEGKRSLGKPKRRWKDNIQMYVRVIAREGVGLQCLLL
jgi:hypothetical protein